MEPVSWTKSSALSWNYDERLGTENRYWSQEILDLFRPLEYRVKEEGDEEEIAIGNSDISDCFLAIEENPGNDQEKNNNENELNNFPIFSTSYETLLLLAAGVVHQIREEYCAGSTGSHSKPGDKAQHQKESIVFAVTIPEGPLLPLSILIVHALNVFFHRNHGHSSYAVLVPMDLDEGKDRNAHILNDASPAFTLSVMGRDSEKLYELIETNRNDDEIGDSDVSAFAGTKILDLVSLVKLARRKISMLPSKVEDSLSAERNFYSQLIESVTTGSMTLQGLVSKLATEIGSLSSGEIKTHYESSTDKISHIVYTSGTTGRPKGCVSSTRSLLHYIAAKNATHEISETSTVLLASALSFDPCLSDVLASLDARATLAITPRDNLVSGLATILKELEVTHVLCTPTLWSLTLLHRFSTPTLKEDFPHLQRVALGGEPIPKTLVQAWARIDPSQSNKTDIDTATGCRLLATYGVTEACVYQTCGEIYSSGPSESGQCVGHVLQGTGFIICEEALQGENLVEVEPGMPGEIVLFGDQVDACTKYLNRPDLDAKFVAQPITNGIHETIRYHYRTGDRGCIRPQDGSLVVLGRIIGEEGMIKINGVRVELGEIEAALLSDEGSSNISSIVTDCLVNCVKDSDDQNVIHAYCVFRDELWKELGMTAMQVTSTKEGVIINGGPLWTILRTKCSNRLRKACIPSGFVGIRQLPLSRTGKRDRSGLPELPSCTFLELHNEISTPLQNYGVAGRKVFDTLVQYLNLQPCQQKMVTASISFAVLGGDSLSAVVVCRTLYAYFHQLQNSRYLGGQYGQLPFPFNTESLLRAKNLGEYVDILDENISTNNIQSELDDQSKIQLMPSVETTRKDPPLETTEKALLYDALLQATTLNQTLIASTLLYLGADPNHGHNHGSRIGNTSGRNQRRAVFKTAPLHLACFRGNPILVNLLLKHKASYNSPNTNGLFPIHLASGGLDDGTQGSNPQEEHRRLECVKSLMEAGCPLLIKDANKQSILHAAARAGHVAILEHAIEEHKSIRYNGPVPLTQFLEFQDKWFRSALHWAVLHGNVKAVEVLLQEGSNPSPYKPRSNNNRQTSMMTETPLEICKRIHGTSAKGVEMEKMLMAAIDARKSVNTIE